MNKINYMIGCFKEKFGHSITDWSFKAQQTLVEWFFGIDPANDVFVCKDGKHFLHTTQSNFGIFAFGELKDDDGPYGVTGFGGMKLTGLPAFRSILQMDFYTRNTAHIYESVQEGLSGTAPRYSTRPPCSCGGG